MYCKAHSECGVGSTERVWICPTAQPASSIAGTGETTERPWALTRSQVVALCKREGHEDNIITHIRKTGATRVVEMHGFPLHCVPQLSDTK